ncbi:MAG: hypothetical protein PHY90_13090 [Desulfitobacteriaceae bacterium]|nr:hypothetical protein [Desulfitobacteriaceae bacterium]
MKIRCDFVTNSSSASFVLTVKEEIIDAKMKRFDETGKTGWVQLLKFLKKKMGEEGYKTIIGSQEYSFTIKEFPLGKSQFLADDSDPEVISKSDFSELSDDEMWAVINWVVVKGESNDILGVGATQTTEPQCKREGCKV